MLDQPTRITRYLSDLSLQNLFANRIFATPGGVTGGGLVYDQLTTNDLYTSRDVQNVEPGPSSRSSTRPGAPQFAPVEKFGGKFFITDEARLTATTRHVPHPGEQAGEHHRPEGQHPGIAALDASISAVGAAVQVSGHSWSAYQPQGSSASLPTASPAADFAAVQLAADTAELGVNYNLWIVNPAQMATLRTVYGQGLAGLLSDNGITMVPTNRVAAGTAYAVEEGMVGEMRFERGLATETWREQATERTWVQSGVSPVFAVTNPYSAVKVTGIA
jgi:hypothetical protein